MKVLFVFADTPAFLRFLHILHSHSCIAQQWYDFKNPAGQNLLWKTHERENKHDSCYLLFLTCCIRLIFRSFFPLSSISLFISPEEVPSLMSAAALTCFYSWSSTLPPASLACCHSNTSTRTAATPSSQPSLRPHPLYHHHPLHAAWLQTPLSPL